MSRNPLADLAGYQAPNMPGEMAALALKARRTCEGAGNPLVPPKQSKQDEKAKFASEMNLLLTPVEQGGALITDKTPIKYLGYNQDGNVGFTPLDASNPNMIPWSRMPKSLTSRTQYDGAIMGFYTPKLSDYQQRAVQYFQGERQKEADAEMSQDADFQRKLAAAQQGASNNE